MLRAIRNDRKLAQRIADACGVTREAVWQWQEQIPAKRVLDVEKITGIPRHKLRPDLYPPSDYRPRRQRLRREL